MTAGPTLAFVVERLAGRRFNGTPDAAYFATLIDALNDRLCRSAVPRRRCRNQRRDLYHPHYGDRPRRDDRGADHNVAVELW